MQTECEVKTGQITWNHSPMTGQGGRLRLDGAAGGANTESSPPSATGSGTPLGPSAALAGSAGFAQDVFHAGGLRLATNVAWHEIVNIPTETTRFNNSDDVANRRGHFSEVRWFQRSKPAPNVNIEHDPLNQRFVDSFHQVRVSRWRTKWLITSGGSVLASSGSFRLSHL